MKVAIIRIRGCQKNVNIPFYRLLCQVIVDADV